LFFSFGRGIFTRITRFFVELFNIHDHVKTGDWIAIRNQYWLATPTASNSDKMYLKSTSTNTQQEYTMQFPVNAPSSQLSQNSK
jgi:hypothetical protein